MTNIERYEGPPAARHQQWIELLAPAAQLAEQIARTDFVPAGLRGNPAAITAAILYGDEIGLSPMQSLSKVHVVDGRPALAAEAQRALVLAAGHEMWLVEANTTRVTWSGRRKGAPADAVTSITWTMDDARRAGLDGRKNWRNYPRAMLSARSSADLCRALFPDVIGGLMAKEELDDGVVIVEAEVMPLDPGDVGDPTPPEGKKVQRADKAKKATRASAGSAGPELPTGDTAPAPQAAAEPPVDALPALPTGPSRSGGTTPDGDDAPPLPDPSAEGDDQGDEGGGLPWPNYYAMKCSEHGLDDDDRHALTLLLTEGRTARSGEMTRDEIEFARVTLDKLKEGTRRIRFVEDSLGGGDWLLEGKANGEAFVERQYRIEPELTNDPGDAASGPSDDVVEAEVVDDGEEPFDPPDPVDDAEEVVDEPPVTSETELQRLMRAKKLRLPDVIRKAGEGRTKATAPTKLADITADPALCARIVEWIRSVES